MVRTKGSSKGCIRCIARKIKVRLELRVSPDHHTNTTVSGSATNQRRIARGVSRLGIPVWGTNDNTANLLTDLPPAQKMLAYPPTLSSKLMLNLSLCMGKAML